MCCIENFEVLLEKRLKPRRWVEIRKTLFFVVVLNSWGCTEERFLKHNLFEQFDTIISYFINNLLKIWLKLFCTTQVIFVALFSPFFSFFPSISSSLFLFLFSSSLHSSFSPSLPHVFLFSLITAISTT